MQFLGIQVLNYFLLKKDGKIDIIKNCVQIKIKNNRNQIFQIKLDECCIFQKITAQEKIILGILDYLEK